MAKELDMKLILGMTESKNPSLHTMRHPGEGVSSLNLGHIQSQNTRRLAVSCPIDTIGETYAKQRPKTYSFM